MGSGACNFSFLLIGRRLFARLGTRNTVTVSRYGRIDPHPSPRSPAPVMGTIVLMDLTIWKISVPKYRTGTLGDFHLSSGSLLAAL